MRLVWTGTQWRPFDASPWSLIGWPRCRVVSFCSVLSSGAMGLPVSGFPNMNAVSLEDPTGLNYVNTADFLKVGAWRHGGMASLRASSW